MQDFFGSMEDRIQAFFKDEGLNPIDHKDYLRQKPFKQRISFCINNFEEEKKSGSLFKKSRASV